jgi:hypothetical protein
VVTAMLAQIRSSCIQHLLQASETSFSHELRLVGMSPPMAGALAGTGDPVTGSLGHVAISQGCDNLTRPTSPATSASPFSATSTADITDTLPRLRSLVPVLTELQTPISALLVFMCLPKIIDTYLDYLIQSSGAPPPCIRDARCIKGGTCFESSRVKNTTPASNRSMSRQCGRTANGLFRSGAEISVNSSGLGNWPCTKPPCCVF